MEIVQFYWLSKDIDSFAFPGMNGRLVEFILRAGFRETWSCIYYRDGERNPIEPLAKVKGFSPEGPCLDSSLRLTLVLFCGNLFQDCPSYLQAIKDLGDTEYLDFERKEEIPESFFRLVEESKQIKISDHFRIFTGIVEPVSKY